MAVIVLAGPAETLVDLQSVDAGFGGAGENRAVDHVLAVPIMLMRNDLTGQELPNRLAVSLVVRPVQGASHRLEPLAAHGVDCQRVSHYFNLA